MAIHAVHTLPTIAHATAAIELDTSLPCAKGPETPNVQLTHLASAESPEGGPKEHLPAEEDQVGHPS